MTLAFILALLDAVAVEAADDVDSWPEARTGGLYWAVHKQGLPGFIWLYTSKNQRVVRLDKFGR
eukprot:scaffold78823_cov22-Tisochrysis_lutea.AAC.2